MAGVFVFGRKVPGFYTGSADDPLVVGFHDRFEVMIVDHTFRDVSAEGCDFCLNMHNGRVLKMEAFTVQPFDTAWLLPVFLVQGWFCLQSNRI
jgi:hypothetical protein